MNAQLKGSFLISLSKKNCLYSSGATLILIFGLKLRKTSQWAVQKGVTLRACLHGSGGPQVGEVTRLGGVTRLSI